MKINIYNFDYSKQKDFVFHLSSDFHLDNPAFDFPFWKEEFDSSKGAYRFINGDWADFILLQDKKRYVKSRDKFEGDDIINQIIDKSENILKPYANEILMIGDGNHERSILKYHSLDPTSMLIRSLNAHKTDKTNLIKHGSYSGFIVLVFRHGKSSRTRRYVIYYNHGTGGTSEVTKGIINFNRRQYFRSDLIWLGHTHSKVQVDMDCEIGVDTHNNIYEKERKGIITGTYLKNTIIEPENKQSNNWNEQKCRTSQAKGGKLLNISLKGENMRAKIADA